MQNTHSSLYMYSYNPRRSKIATLRFGYAHVITMFVSVCCVFLRVTKGIVKNKKSKLVLLGLVTHSDNTDSTFALLFLFLSYFVNRSHCETSFLER